MRSHLLSLLVLAACSPTVQGKALQLTGGTKRVAVAGAVRDAYTQGVENALMQLGGKNFQLLSRSEQKALGDEKSLQYSGDFSDEQVVSLGKQLGAELLFVVRDETQRYERPEDPNLENCQFKYGGSSFDDDAKKAQNAAAVKECEAKNDAERKRAAAAPPHISHRYRTNVRVIDVATGEMLAFGDADIQDGQAGFTCVYPCTRDTAGDLAVRAILGVPPK